MLKIVKIWKLQISGKKCMLAAKELKRSFSNHLQRCFSVLAYFSSSETFLGGTRQLYFTYKWNSLPVLQKQETKNSELTSRETNAFAVNLQSKPGF